VFFRFIACQQALVFPGTNEQSVIAMDDGFWHDLDVLTNDEIIGVRISLARFIGLLRGRFTELASVVSGWHLIIDSLQLNFPDSHIFLHQPAFGIS
jgi:hypothetical protein